jgi:hypothetical protein
MTSGRAMGYISSSLDEAIAESRGTLGGIPGFRLRFIRATHEGVLS